MYRHIEGIASHWEEKGAGSVGPDRVRYIATSVRNVNLKRQSVVSYKENLMALKEAICLLSRQGLRARGGRAKEDTRPKAGRT